MNICANFDILFYLSHPRNKYAEQTLFEINTMLYLAELLSIYDGCNAQKWGYGFARNKYGAPVSIELMEEVEFLCAKGYLSKDSSGYYRISDTASLNSILPFVGQQVFLVDLIVVGMIKIDRPEIGMDGVFRKIALS